MRNTKLAKRILRTIGIREGQTVLDCCCGAGVYTLSAAEIVGPSGTVYAIDRSSRKIEQLRERMAADSLHNVKAIEADILSDTSLSGVRFDVILLYDIFWYFRPRGSNTKRLLNKVNTLAKEDALISVYPTHADSRSVEHFEGQMKDLGFALEGEYVGPMLHQGRTQKGRLLNFRKSLDR